MAPRKDEQIENFFELRRGIESLVAFASAALHFLDQHGIALHARRAFIRKELADLTSTRDTAQTLRQTVKRHYVTQRQLASATNGNNGTLPTPTAAAKHAASARRYTDKQRATRARSAALLARLDRTEVRLFEDPQDRTRMGALVRRGYAKRKGDGYVLTAKASRFAVAAEGTPTREAVRGDALTTKEAAQQIGISDSYVRLLVKQGILKAQTTMRARAGFHKPVKTVVFDAEAINHYAAERRAAAGEAS